MSFLTGKTVKEVRMTTPAEEKELGWETSVIEFTDGTLIFAARDHEGNGPGAFFGVTHDNQTFQF